MHLILPQKWSSNKLQKTVETTCNVNGNKIANKLTNSPQNTSETVENQTEIRKERYISPEKRQN